MCEQTWSRMRRELERLVQMDSGGPAGRVSQASKVTPNQTQLLGPSGCRSHFGSGPPRVQTSPKPRSHTPAPANSS